MNKMQLQENEILYKETLLMCKLDTWSIEELKSWINLQQQIVIKYTLKGYLREGLTRKKKSVKLKN